jgi:hypothetical protein
MKWSWQRAQWLRPDGGGGTSRRGCRDRPSSRACMVAGGGNGMLAMDVEIRSQFCLPTTSSMQFHPYNHLSITYYHAEPLRHKTIAICSTEWLVAAPAASGRHGSLL